MSKCRGKGSWPELVGKAGKDAKRIIESENPSVDAKIVELGSIVSADFRCNRVWVWVTKTTGKVAKTPIIG